ncbi:MAG: acetate--CoA ligase family protein [Candidatus Woesearchaeota archaeon]|jgi:acetyl coenzyme A synthetase (ADP forming)-like protein|nr:acetate--CoA ligase family protein [Candidatus Woesearchaeota archaeon]
MIQKVLNVNSDKSLDKLFYPKSIAVIGASNDVSKIGGFIFSNIKKLSGLNIYPISVKFEKIQEVRAYTNIIEIKSSVDLAIIAIPKDYVINSLKDCIKANIKNVVIISAGFKETGEEGRIREEKIKKIVLENEINLVGPNCLGILNSDIGLNCSFAKDIPKNGDVALISQSGAVIDAIIDWSFKQNIGFSKIISLGNMAGVNELSILKYLKDDKKTKAIVFYMETLENGKEFQKVLREVSKTKPVIIIKPGNSDSAKAAIGSHTGSLAQDNILVKTAINESNGILVNTLNELFNTLIGLKTNLPVNNKLIILTNAGGPGVIATDFAVENNLELYKLSNEQKVKFDFLPKEGSLNNPIDILGDAKSDRYTSALEEIEKIKDVSNILILLTPQMMTDSLEIAKNIAKISKKSKKTIYVSFLGSKEIFEATKYFDDNGVASFFTPSDVIKSMKKLLDYNCFEYINKNAKYKFSNTKVKEVNKILENKKGLLDFELTKKIMDILKINLPEKIVFKDIDEVLSTKISSNKKFILKVDSKSAIHKIDLGGVEFNIDSENFKDRTIEMFDKISKKIKDFTITLEEEVKGFETIIGLKSEDNLGNFIMFGMGGTYVSLFNDVNFATCPLTKTSSEALVKSSRAYKGLNGFRGTRPIHFEHLYEILIRISYLQETFPLIKEVDLNPVICSDKGIYLVDVKLIV